MWLRVEQHLIKWEALSGLPEEEQKHRAELLLEEKSASLIKRCQAEGRYFPEFLLDFKLLCMPEGFESELSDSKEIPRRHRSCSSWCCVHIQEDEQKWPMVHLPYFWSQKAIHTLEPPEGHLLKLDPGWRNWRPRMPLSVLGRLPEWRSLRLPLPAPAPESAEPVAELQEPKEPKEVQKIEMNLLEKGDKKPKKEKKEQSEKAKKEKKEKSAKKDKDEKKKKRKAKKEEGTLQGRGRGGRTSRGRGRPKGGKAKVLQVLQVLPRDPDGVLDGDPKTPTGEERRKRVFGTNVINLGAKVLRLEHQEDDEDELLCRSSSFSQNLRPESEGNEAIDLEI